MGAAAAHEPPGQRARGRTVSVGDRSGDDRGAVALRALQEPLASGREVIRHNRLVAAEGVEIDDVDVGPPPRGQDASIVQADGTRRRAR